MTTNSCLSEEVNKNIQASVNNDSDLEYIILTTQTFKMDSYKWYYLNYNLDLYNYYTNIKKEDEYNSRIKALQETINKMYDDFEIDCAKKRKYC